MEKIVEQRLPQIKQLMQQYGVEKAYLFGSAARGAMHENSDIITQILLFDLYRYFKMKFNDTD
jgi:predicted nucleotidyltransferase